MDTSAKNSPWFKQGLKFKCTGCGKCCTGAPGYVWVSQEEIKEMADFLKISEKEFIRLYTRQVFGKYSLIEDKKTYDCVFLKDNQCQVYGARPTQCRTFPWWQSNLESKKSWQQAAKDCEGIDHPDAPLISLETILEQLNLN